jgi:acetyl esterase/lipase
MPLWPEGKMPDAQPQQIAAFLQAQQAPGFNPDEHRLPYIEWMPPPAKPNGVCMILISGGGYRRLADAIHVRVWNERFTAIGCQCVTLVYRTPRPEGIEIWRTAWEDGQRAVRLVRREARMRGFDPEKIGTMSHSAGSHLALLLCASSQTSAYAPVDHLDRDVSCHINFAVTGAIAYGLVSEKGKGGVRLDDCFRFDAKTAPMCMFHGGIDPITPLSSTYAYRELRRRKVPAELHLFADRKHGFYGKNPGKRESTAYDNWFARAHEFMIQLGFLGELEKEVSLMERFPADFHDTAKYEKRNLWPDGKMPHRQLKENGADAQGTAYLEWYIPAKLTTKSIQIIYSGGAYVGNSPNGFEVAPMRRFLNEKGMVVVTMKYRSPRPKNIPKHMTAWADLQRCIRIVRSEAPVRGLDPNRIGIMGSSAGGHLLRSCRVLPFRAAGRIVRGRRVCTGFRPDVQDEGLGKEAPNFLQRRTGRGNDRVRVGGQVDRFLRVRRKRSNLLFRLRHVQPDLQAGILAEKVFRHVPVSGGGKQRRKVFRDAFPKRLHTLGSGIERSGQRIRQRPVLRQDLLQAAHAGLIDIHPEGCQELLISHAVTSFQLWTQKNDKCYHDADKRSHLDRQTLKLMN